MIKQCIQCSKPIVAQRNTRKFCGNACGMNYRYKHVKFEDRQCIQCSTTFTPIGSNNRFCTINCGRKYHSKEARTKYRKRILTMYGNKCSCCGETKKEFLTIEHLNGGGRKHRSGRGSETVYREIAQEYRPDLYAILCMNCNHAKGIYGFCPHEKER